MPKTKLTTTCHLLKLDTIITHTFLYFSDSFQTINKQIRTETQLIKYAISFKTNLFAL